MPRSREWRNDERRRIKNERHHFRVRDDFIRLMRAVSFVAPATRLQQPRLELVDVLRMKCPKQESHSAGGADPGPPPPLPCLPLSHPRPPAPRHAKPCGRLLVPVQLGRVLANWSWPKGMAHVESWRGWRQKLGSSARSCRIGVHFFGFSRGLGFSVGALGSDLAEKRTTRTSSLVVWSLSLFSNTVSGLVRRFI